MYFSEITPDSIITDKDADFRFTYNANSGGGQAFLAGKFRDKSGNLTSPTVLDDYNIALQFSFVGADGVQRTVQLADDSTRYKIKPRGGDSPQMKFVTDAGTVNPNKAVAAFFMLPPPCGVRKAKDLDESCLTSNNYWLQDMPFTVDVTGEREATFSVTRCVFCGGVDSRREGEQRGQQRYFVFDHSKRITDIIHASENSDSLPTEVSTCINLFAAIYKGERSFSFVECANAITEVMRFLASKFPEKYSGIGDAFSFIKNNMLQQNQDAQPAHTLVSSLSRNRIYFGAPGTGKSHKLKKDCKDNHFREANCVRVTFYPTYSYSQFVGSYKPTTVDGKVEYAYVPGPFISILVNAKKAPQEDFLLIIEELNRANAPAVFGDLFQLLDRLPDGTSEYPVAAGYDLCKYLASQGIDDAIISLPSNLYIWTTMNSADQGVFPLDTAFKRRWDFEYLGIDTNEAEIPKASFKFADGPYRWNDVRKAINKKLLESKINEDKLIGPFFIKPETLNNEDPSVFIEAFKSKVLMYLFEDAIRHKPSALFKGENGIFSYSIICRQLETDGLKGVFNFDIKQDDSGNPAPAAGSDDKKADE